MRPSGCNHQVARALLAAALSCAAAVASPQSVADVETERTLVEALAYDARKGVLTGWVPQGADRAEVVRRIGELAGADVEIGVKLGVLSKAVVFDHVSAEHSVRQLLSRESVVFLYDDVNDKGTVLRKIWVVADGLPPNPVAQASSPSPVAQTEAPAEELSRDDRAVALRDLVKLSYNADARSIRRLEDIAKDAKDPAERKAALSALAGLSEAYSGEVFVTHGLRDRDAAVRIEAARSLLRTNNIHADALIRNAAEKEADMLIRETLNDLARGETVERAGSLDRTRVTE